MKKITLFYFTLTLTLIVIAGADSIYAEGWIVPAISILSVLIIACYVIIGVEDIEKLLKDKDKELK